MMNNLMRYVAVPIVSLSCILFTSNGYAVTEVVPAQNGSMMQTKPMTDEPMSAHLQTNGAIVDVLMANPNFSTLVAAIKAADLLPALQSGSFTIFAPSNAAFDKLPSGTLQNLLKLENRDKLKAILTYHIVPVKMMAADIKSGSVKTLNGKEVTITVGPGGMMIDKAKVVKSDVPAGTSEIDEIDTVLMP